MYSLAIIAISRESGEESLGRFYTEITLKRKNGIWILDDYSKVPTKSEVSPIKSCMGAGDVASSIASVTYLQVLTPMHYPSTQNGERKVKKKGKKTSFNRINMKSTETVNIIMETLRPSIKFSPPNQPGFMLLLFFLLCLHVLGEDSSPHQLAIYVGEELGPQYFVKCTATQQQGRMKLLCDGSHVYVISNRLCQSFMLRVDVHTDISFSSSQMKAPFLALPMSKLEAERKSLSGLHEDKAYVLVVALLVSIIGGWVVIKYRRQERQERGIEATENEDKQNSEKVDIAEEVDNEASEKVEEDKEKVTSKDKFPSLSTFSHDLSVEDQTIGKIIITSKQIGHGSNGTVVFEGRLEERRVAVKRLIRSHQNLADKEMSVLVRAGIHSNIVRYHGYESDRDFIYLCLELCECTLWDFIAAYSTTTSRRRITEHDLIKKERVKQTFGTNVNLLRSDGHPSDQLTKLMRGIVEGVGFLHNNEIVHRDLKPENILMVKDGNGKILAKVSDMGICKELKGETSFTWHSSGSGTPGWHAPEQLKHERLSQSTDMFNLGCILFFCMSGGYHPFGENDNRADKVKKNKKNLSLLHTKMPEFVGLFERLLNRIPSSRPSVVELLRHPMFWDSSKRLSFLIDASDRFESDDLRTCAIVVGLESSGSTDFVSYGVGFPKRWDSKLDRDLCLDLMRPDRRKYDFSSVIDLLRVIRNKHAHFMELSTGLQELLGGQRYQEKDERDEKFDCYFSGRFPHLFFAVYEAILQHCSTEDAFCNYFV
ncbi:hypothetical protein C2S51_032414 [Perilla frutescens var. frutescens]|nr:hypothetical protein C2S51_032414 [Perilla frutescens var. frutescens]